MDTFGPSCGSAARVGLFKKQANKQKLLVRKNSQQWQHLHTWPAGYPGSTDDELSSFVPMTIEYGCPLAHSVSVNWMRCSFLSATCIHPPYVTGFVYHFLKNLFQLPSSSSWFPVTAAELGPLWPWGLGSLALWGSTGLHVGDKACKGGGSEQLLSPRDEVTKLQKGKRPFLCIARKLRLFFSTEASHCASSWLLFCLCVSVTCSSLQASALWTAPTLNAEVTCTSFGLGFLNYKIQKETNSSPEVASESEILWFYTLLGQKSLNHTLKRKKTLKHRRCIFILFWALTKLGVSKASDVQHGWQRLLPRPPHDPLPSPRNI